VSLHRELAERLAATALADAMLTEVPLPEGAGTTWVVDLPAGDLLSLWTEARRPLAALELYPVAVTGWGARDWIDADLFNRFYYGDDSAPQAVIERAAALTLEDALGRYPVRHDWAAANWDNIVAHQLDVTRSHYRGAPDPAALGDVPIGDELALERVLLDWEEGVRPTNPPELDISFGWYDPPSVDRIGLVLLPVTEPCHAAAYLSFFGAEGPGRHESLTRLMSSWQHRYGAQLVANWGTMLEFVAESPPTTLEDAFELAAEHVRVAPCTTILPGEGVRGLARHLWRGEHWFLHERP
jgi:Domain of unknown function (DUF4253)